MRLHPDSLDSSGFMVFFSIFGPLDEPSAHKISKEPCIFLSNQYSPDIASMVRIPAEVNNLFRFMTDSFPSKSGFTNKNILESSHSLFASMKMKEETRSLLSKGSRMISSPSCKIGYLVDMAPLENANLPKGRCMTESFIMFFLSILRLEYASYDAPANEPFPTYTSPTLDATSFPRERSVTNEKPIGVSCTLNTWGRIKSFGASMGDSRSVRPSLQGLRKIRSQSGFFQVLKNISFSILLSFDASPRRKGLHLFTFI